MARTFQVVRPLQRMTTLDNVIASAFLRAKDKAEAREMALESSPIYRPLRGPGCCVQRASPWAKEKNSRSARALATQPEMLLLDESFAGLNPSEQNELIEIIER